MTARRVNPALPPIVGKRVQGFLYCRLCQRSWAFYGHNEPETWPTHRCGRVVAPFHELLGEDPNRVPLPKGVKLP